MSAPLTQLASDLWLPSRELWWSSALSQKGGLRWCGRTYELARPNQWHGLVGAWPLWDGAGLTAEDVAGVNHVTLTNGPTWNSLVERNGLRFDGIDDYVAGPTLDCPLSMTAWVSRSSSHTGRYITFGYGVNLFTIYNSATSVSALYNGGSTGTWTIPQDESHHVALVYYQSEGKAYHFHNGTTVGSTTKSQVVSQLQLLFGGFNLTPSQPLHGFMNDIRAYNRSLSSSEILEFYADSLDGGCSLFLLEQQPLRVAFPAAVGGPFPHYTRRHMTGGMITMG